MQCFVLGLTFFLTIFSYCSAKRKPKCDEKRGFVMGEVCPCPLSCEYPLPARLCTKQACMSGCTCKDGYLPLTQNGIITCIPADQCPVEKPEVCDESKGFIEGLVCPYPPMCDNPNEPNVKMHCCKMGCVCRDGLLAHCQNGLVTCVQQDQCP